MPNTITLPATNRRAFLSRALAGAAGATIGATAAMPTTKAAIGAPDPIPALVDEYFRLVDEVNGGGSVEHTDRAFDQEEAVGERIYDVVAPTVAGILAQLRLLRECVEIGSSWIDDRDMRLFDSITSGLRALAAGGAA